VDNEMRAKEFTPKDIHKLADSKGVKWDNEPSFLKLTKQLTGKEHLDDLDQEDLKKVKQHLEKIKEGVANSCTLEERKKKRRVRRAAYGPGPYGMYGSAVGYSGDSSGGDGGGGESIHELFDGGNDWKWTYQDKNQASAEFTVGNVHYTFMAGQDPDEAPGDWDIEFAAKRAHGTASWGITGTGNSAQVFGTVVEIMKAFLASKKASIRRMTFAAKEDSRQGLYARMVKRLLPKWHLEQNGEAFVLTRPGGLAFWVYSVEAPYNKIPAVRVKANSAREAEQIVLTTMPKFQGADLMGMGASKNKPDLTAKEGYGNHPSQRVDPRTGKRYVPPKSPLNQGVAEGVASMLVNKIFFARSNKTPKGWSYDHVGFITQDGKQIQMSGHKGNDVYITNAVTDDPEFLKQNIKIVSLPKPVSVPTTNTVGAENCGTFVANVLQANGVKGVDTQKIYSVFKKPPEQKLPENFVTEDAVMGKIADSGKIVRILKKQHTVPFSDEKNWLLIDTDPAKGNKGLGIKWIPADTRFEWVRPYRDTVDENFADGKNPQDKGDAKRHGVPTKAGVTTLRKVAKQGGRKGQLAHWMANMKSGRAK
jgi:hypothetical protein